MQFLYSLTWKNLFYFSHIVTIFNDEWKFPNEPWNLYEKKKENVKFLCFTNKRKTQSTHGCNYDNADVTKDYEFYGATGGVMEWRGGW